MKSFYRRLRSKVSLLYGPKVSTLLISLDIPWSHLTCLTVSLFIAGGDPEDYGCFGCVVNVGRGQSGSCHRTATATGHSTPHKCQLGCSRWSFPLCFQGAPRKGVHFPYSAKVTHVNIRDIIKDDIWPIEKIDTLDSFLMQWAYSRLFDLFCKY